MVNFAQRLGAPQAHLGEYSEKADWRETEAELQSQLKSKAAELQSLIEPRRPRDAAYASDLAQLKRFIERWRADEGFREALLTDAGSAVLKYGLQTDPELLRSYWTDTEHRALGETTEDEPQLIRRHRFFLREKLLHREKLRCLECVPKHPGHRAWRQRQVRRSLGHLGAKSHDSIIHAPFAIELSHGCSVGCWFCGVSAKRKGGDYLYTDHHRDEWRDICSSLKKHFGPAARTGFLYWATDPLDNPDYEKFGLDFANICGRFPQTTTAIAHKDIERTRRLLELSIEHGCTINRFSIIGLGQFNRIMNAFTPEELLYCEIVSQNKEASHVQSSAGRARGSDRLQQRAEKRAGQTWQEVPGTIACISGFLINMVLRTIKLITPCPANERWPDGYWVLDEATFDGAADFDTVLAGLMEKNFCDRLRAFDSVRFRADLNFEATEHGFHLHSYGAKFKYGGPGPEFAPHLRELGQAIAAGDSTTGEIVLDFERRFNRAPELTFRLMAHMFDAGLLDEEPAGQCQ